MTKVLLLYYSVYGHVETTANAVAEGARSVEGVEMWLSGGLVGMAGSVFTSTATQHGGQETTITSLHSTLLHHGMVVVGVPYSRKELVEMTEITGGSLYGAGTLAGGDGKSGGTPQRKEWS